MNTNFLIVPGYGNSNEDHWQTYFQNNLPNCYRIEQKSWDTPLLNDWVTKIDHEVNNFPIESIVLISHSLGGIAIAHWANRFGRKIKGAFIVAPPDIENPYIDLALESFTPIPKIKFSFPCVVIGSTNDYWSTEERTKTFARNWGSELILIKEAGHINPESGYGEWNEGLELLKNTCF